MKKRTIYRRQRVAHKNDSCEVTVVEEVDVKSNIFNYGGFCRVTLQPIVVIVRIADTTTAYDMEGAETAPGSLLEVS